LLPKSAVASKPFALHSPDQDAYQSDFPNSPITNPGMNEQGGGFQFSICNGSQTRTHVLTAVSAKIITLAAFSGEVNQWQGCDGTFSSHHQLVGGGCGGGLAGCICLHATFPGSVAAGTVGPTGHT